MIFNNEEPKYIFILYRNINISIFVHLFTLQWRKNSNFKESAKKGNSHRHGITRSCLKNPSLEEMKDFPSPKEGSDVRTTLGFRRKIRRGSSETKRNETKWNEEELSAETSDGGWNRKFKFRERLARVVDTQPLLTLLVARCIVQIQFLAIIRKKIV